MRLGYPVVRAAMNLNYGIGEDRAPKARARIEAALDRIVAETGPSGYLVGDRFSVADLTVAAILGPLVMPPGVPHPVLDVPPALEELREAARAHPAGAWVVDVYARHRGVSAAVGRAPS